MSKNNAMNIFLLGLATVAAGFGWAMNLWGGWSEKTYARMKKSGNSWIVLRAFKIEQTERNCIQFLKMASAFGLFVVVPAILFVLVHFGMRK
jgi:hypothetical protein